MSALVISASSCYEDFLQSWMFMWTACAEDVGLAVWRHLVGSSKNLVLPGCQLAHSLAGHNGLEPRSRTTVCLLFCPLPLAELQLWP